MGETIISQDLTIIGNVTSKGNVKLDGKIRGDIHCASLVVSESGDIDGGIIANNEVIVLGLFWKSMIKILNNQETKKLIVTKEPVQQV
jgi:cytoskeletal protein CcmA (bactofilin family)